MNVYQSDAGDNRALLKQAEKCNARVRSLGNKWRSKYLCFPFEILQEGRENTNISRPNPVLSGREVNGGVHAFLVEDEGRISDWNRNKLQTSSQEGEDLLRNLVLNFYTLWLTGFVKKSKRYCHYIDCIDIWITLCEKWVRGNCDECWAKAREEICVMLMKKSS